MSIETTTAADLVAKGGPFCPECGEPMKHYGGTAGYICHQYKLLVRNGGWFEDGVHVEDHRLAGPRQEGGMACVAGEVRER